MPPAERIAVFDNDGTLWSEQPIYFQLAFALDRVKALAPQHPEWKTTEPFAIAAGRRRRRRARGGREGDRRDHGGDARRHDDRRVRRRSVSDWLATAQAPALRAALHRDGLPADARAARLSARERLQDLHRLRRRRRVHARRWRRRSTASRPSRSSAAAASTKFELRDGKPVLVKRAGDRLHRRQGRASRSASTSFIGRRPIVAFGNSDGDLQMLQWTAAGARPRACLASSTTPTPSASGRTTGSRTSGGSTRRSTRRPPRAGRSWT